MKFFIYKSRFCLLSDDAEGDLKSALQKVPQNGSYKLFISVTGTRKNLKTRWRITNRYLRNFEERYNVQMTDKGFQAAVGLKTMPMLLCDLFLFPKMSGPAGWRNNILITCSDGPRNMDRPMRATSARGDISRAAKS